MVMDFDWLRDFLALAEHRTFSRAAEVRNITQPAFSRRVRALEEWIGTALFARSAQGAALTPAGLYFRPQAQALLGLLERARRETRSVGESETAALAIAATHALSFTFFPGWVREVTRSRAPGAINLISDSMTACEQLLLSGQVHFLLCHFHPDARAGLAADRFPSLRVGDDVLVPMCAPDAQGQAKWSLESGRTPPIPYLSYGEASGLGRIITACQGDKLAHAVTRFTSQLAATLATMARDGHGVAWLPRTLTSEDQRRGQLVRAGSERFDIPVEIRLFRSLETRNRAADELWDDIAGA